MSAQITSDYWCRLQGIRLGGVFELSEWVGEDGKRAFYFTPPAAEGNPRRVIAAIGGISPEVEDQLRSWNIAAEMLHPHLVRVHETGIAQVDGQPLAYAVMDVPDEALGEVIRERALTTEETSEVVRALLPALEYLHARELVHGEVDPGNIVSSGGVIQLLNHELRVATDDPAWSADPRSTAGDIRAFGYTIYQLLTRSRDARLELIDTVPEPFRAIINGCVNQKWTLRRVAEALDPSPVPMLAPVDPVRKPAPSSRIPKWGYAAACLAVTLAAMLMLLPRPKPAAPQPAAPIVAAPPAIVQPAKPPANPIVSGDWRVIAYTYARLADAEYRVTMIRTRWPHLKPEVLKPRDKASPYQVSIGGHMTHLDALKLQSQARTMGLPRDTFARRF